MPTDIQKTGHTHDHGHTHENHWFKALFGLLWGAGILAISISGLFLPFMAYLALTGLSSLVTLYLGRKMYVAAWKSLLQWEWNTNTLYSISTLTILSVSILSLFITGLPPMVMGAG